MSGESASTHDEYKYRYIRSDNDTGTRNRQRSHTLDLVRNLTQPLIQLACQRASIARIPRARMRSFPGRHSESLPRFQVVESVDSSGRWSSRAVVTVGYSWSVSKAGKSGRRHSGVGAGPGGCRSSCCSACRE